MHWCGFCFAYFEGYRVFGNIVDAFGYENALGHIFCARYLVLICKLIEVATSTFSDMYLGRGHEHGDGTLDMSFRDI